MVELPYDVWIRVEFYAGAALASLLINSRQEHTLRSAKRATLRLYERLVDWYTEEQLRWVEEER